jgi:hypothetical protein
MESDVLFSGQVCHIFLSIFVLVEADIFLGIVLGEPEVQRTFSTSPELPDSVLPLHNACLVALAIGTTGRLKGRVFDQRLQQKLGFAHDAFHPNCSGNPGFSMEGAWMIKGYQDESV